MTGNTTLRRMRLGALAQAGASTGAMGKAELAVSGIQAYALREPVSKRAREAGQLVCLVPALAGVSPNQGQAFVKATRNRLEKLRAEGGPDVDFVLDGGGRLTPGDSASLATELERFHLLWFDEPCRIS